MPLAMRTNDFSTTGSGIVDSVASCQSAGIEKRTPPGTSSEIQCGASTGRVPVRHKVPLWTPSSADPLERIDLMQYDASLCQVVRAVFFLACELVLFCWSAGCRRVVAGPG